MSDSSIDRRLERLRGKLRRPRYFFVPQEVIARCVACDQAFTWLPPNFDMRHRFNYETHKLCGGKIVQTRKW